MNKAAASEPRFELVAIADIELPDYNPRSISEKDLKNSGNLLRWFRSIQKPLKRLMIHSPAPIRFGVWG